MLDQTILIDILCKVMAIWGLLLVVCSIIFNFLVCFICLKSSQLRSTSTFKFLAIGAINDMIMCFAWNFDDFTSIFFGYEAYSQILFYCEYIDLFIQYATITYSSWILVSISLNRVLSLNIQKWTNQYFQGLRPVYYSAILALIVLGSYIPLVFKGGFSYQNENDTEIIIVCFAESSNSTEIYDFMNQVANDL
jgi:hypothetical protein